MTFTEADKQAMDDAAIDAENDLVEVTDREGGHQAFEIVANWWAKWYPTAGHKRLARILLQCKTKEAKWR